EFKLHWVNFPQFKPANGEIIGIDAELSYSDGGPRSYRSFAFGNPLSVVTPANLARIQLVDRLNRSHWQRCPPIIAPIRVDARWNQAGHPHIVGQIALPPGRREEIGDITFQVMDLSGNVIGRYPAGRETVLQKDGDFAIREASWPIEVAPASGYFVC